MANGGLVDAPPPPSRPSLLPLAPPQCSPVKSLGNILVLVTTWLLILAPATLCAQTTRPTISLVTFGPGEELYERFGHNALRIQDSTLRPPYDDVSFNYGIFSFGENVLTDFLPGFVQGTLRYWVAPEKTPEMLDIYRKNNRTIILQELNLNREQSLRLAGFLWNNAKPENRGYVYAPYDDNCSTRVRDAIDQAVDEQLEAQTQDLVPGHTYRFHTRRATASNPFVFIGLEFILGQNVDRDLTRWQEMFLPGRMQIHLRTVTITRDNSETVPLVRSEQVPYQATRSDLPDTPPRVLPWFAAAGLLMTAVLLILAQRQQHALARIAVNTLVLLWTLLATFAGCIGSYLMFLTNHWATYRNENLLQMPPFALVLLLLLPWALRRRTIPPRHPLALRISQYVAVAMAGSSVLGLGLKLLPWFRQDNWNIIAWVLPVNIAVAIILYRRPATVMNKGK